jgi:hypothetical protein
MQTKVTLLEQRDQQDGNTSIKFRIDGDGGPTFNEVMEQIRESMAPPYGCYNRVSGRITLEFKDAYVTSIGMDGNPHSLEATLILPESPDVAVNMQSTTMKYLDAAE